MFPWNEDSGDSPALVAPALPTPLLNEPGCGSAKAAYSFRLLDQNLYLQPCVRLRRTSDNHEFDFPVFNNWLGLTSIAENSSDPADDGQTIATLFAGTDGRIVRFYDWSGNSLTVTRNVTATQVLLISNGAFLTLNGNPCADFTGSPGVSYLSSANIGISGNALITSSFVGSYDIVTLSKCVYCMGTSGALAGASHWIAIANSGKHSMAFHGSNNFNDNAAVVAATQYNICMTKASGAIATNTNVFVNGVVGGNQGGSSAGTPNITNAILTLGEFVGSGNTYDGKFQELVIWDSNTPPVATVFANCDRDYIIP